MKKLYRSRENRMLLGTCGGIAHFFSLSPALTRLLALLFFILSFFLLPLILYLCTAFFIPLESRENVSHSPYKLCRSREHRKIAGICGGIGVLLDLDPTLIRLFLLILSFLPGMFFFSFTYILGWVLIPLASPFANELEEKN